MDNPDPLVAYPDEPHIEGGNHQPYLAYNQGYDAGEDETPISLNPYPDDSIEYRFWSHGWYDGAEVIEPE